VLILAAAILSMSCAIVSPTAPDPPDGLSPDFERDVITLVNQHRTNGASCGQAVNVGGADRNAGRAARDHSLDMAANHYLSHTGLDGRNFVQRMLDASYTGRPLGEAIALGQSSPAAVVAAWMTSPHHCTIIMLPDARDIGVGYASGYWTLDLGAE